jgi:hypothetical protein
VTTLAAAPTLDGAADAGARFAAPLLRDVRPAGGRRQRFADRRGDLGRLTRFELREEPEHARASLRGLVRPDVELRDAPEPDPRAQLATHERHRTLERPHRPRSIVRLTDDAHPDAGGAQVRRGLDVRDGDEPDPRVLHVARKDRADLLAQQLIDPISSCSHVPKSLRRDAESARRFEFSEGRAKAPRALGPRIRRRRRGP